MDSEVVYGGGKGRRLPLENIGAQEERAAAPSST